MTEHIASRTLVKSAPELWLACSEEESLARHLEPFGEIRITRLEPETTVAWEGDAACGTVMLEPSGWGTRVTLTVVEREQPEPEILSPATVEPAPAGEEPVAAGEEPVAAGEEQVPAAEEPPDVRVAGRPGFWARLFGRRAPKDTTPRDATPKDTAARDDAPVGSTTTASPAPEIEADDGPTDAPVLENERPDPAAALDAMLDHLGRAHHRPFSRG